MGAKYGEFKYSIGDKIVSNNRNLIIVDREYRQVSKSKNGKQFIANQKYYKYKCLNCGNEDWIIEYSIDKQMCGCNVCCNSPKKVVKGINDIGTTAKWMIKYFANIDDTYCNTKYSKNKVNFVCPDCGRVHNKEIYKVMSNKGLTCPCGDGWSYPNKFMYSLLEQLGVTFETEKVFGWSNNLIYDDYIEYNGLKIITEQQGVQHYQKPIIKGSKYRTVEEEKENDVKKQHLAYANGIDYYFMIDTSKSELDYIKNSIISSGLLNILNVCDEDIDWNKCDEFATSNLIKLVCIYKETHSTLTLREISKKFHISYKTTLDYIKRGNKFGWCKYEIGTDRKILENTHSIYHGQKPILCVDNQMYYRDANTASEHLSTDTIQLFPRQLRKQITREQKYKGYKFVYISIDEFNNAKSKSPLKVVGDFFYATT